jgi:hypothetical protein
MNGSLPYGLGPVSSSLAAAVAGVPWVALAVLLVAVPYVAIGLLRVREVFRARQSRTRLLPR